MDWRDALSDMFQRYTGAATAAAPQDPHTDFQQVAQAAPQQDIATGISQAFRSDQTPAFPQMLASLFERSDPQQRAGLLNRLMGSLGPGGISALPGLAGLSGLLSGGSITPQQATQISPTQVQQIAAHAERQNPSIVDEVSSFYAQHPQVMQAVGGLALTIALQHILKR
ncbi:MAG: hypothetical protein JOZ62_16450 [Acidobacteriaceae bacterium]|nr:hypothetical protein [Acidobacteriaceae bacterium]